MRKIFLNMIWSEKYRPWGEKLLLILLQFLRRKIQMTRAIIFEKAYEGVSIYLWWKRPLRKLKMNFNKDQKKACISVFLNLILIPFEVVIRTMILLSLLLFIKVLEDLTNTFSITEINMYIRIAIICRW